MYIVETMYIENISSEIYIMYVCLFVCLALFLTCKCTFLFWTGIFLRVNKNPDVLEIVIQS